MICRRLVSLRSLNLVHHPNAGRCLVRIAVGAGLLLALATAAAPGAFAQELEPRAYSPSPVGANFFAVAYANTSGSILFDPSIPITDVEARFNGLALGYGHTFDFLGKEALITAAIPYVRGNLSGKVFEQEHDIYRSGLSDLRARLSVNLVGNNAMTPKEFAGRAPEPLVVGVSLSVIAPTGQYDPAKLINIGTNRWSVKPEVGISYNIKAKLYLDFYAGVWLYSDNTAFYPGTNTRQFDPLTVLQFHVSYTFAPRSWIALDATGYTGGATHVDNGAEVSRQENLRLGATGAIGITHSQSIKVSFSYGPSPRIGSDFTTYTAAWQILWF